jgi:hypothetical protein
MILAELDSTSPKVTIRSRYRVFTYRQTILRCWVHPSSPDALFEKKSANQKQSRANRSSNRFNVYSHFAETSETEEWCREWDVQHYHSIDCQPKGTKRDKRKSRNSFHACYCSARLWLGGSGTLCPPHNRYCHHGGVRVREQKPLSVPEMFLRSSRLPGTRGILRVRRSSPLQLHSQLLSRTVHRCQPFRRRRWQTTCF